MNLFKQKRLCSKTHSFKSDSNLGYFEVFEVLRSSFLGFSLSSLLVLKVPFYKDCIIKPYYKRLFAYYIRENTVCFKS